MRALLNRRTMVGQMLPARSMAEQAWNCSSHAETPQAYRPIGLACHAAMTSADRGTAPTAPKKTRRGCVDGPWCLQCRGGTQVKPAGKRRWVRA